MKPDGLLKMKIAFAVHDYSRGFGHGRYVVELAERFCVEHEVHIFANTFGETEKAGMHFHHVPAWRKTALLSVLSFLLPCSLKLRGDFDIIHAQGLCCWQFNVLTAHICNRAWFASQKKLTGKLDFKQHVFNSIVTPLEALLYRTSKQSEVIAISQLMRENLIESYGRKERVTVIYHGVDSDKFHPRNRALYKAEIRRELKLSENEFVALFVGDLRKGALATIKALSKTSNIRLVFVSRSAQEPYRRLADDLLVGERVVFRPPTDKIEKYYAAADVFVLPTPYDTYGMVISEAMAAGLPIITNRQAGVAELIEHGIDGLLLDVAFDDETIAYHLQSLRDDPQLCERLGQAGRDTIKQYSWDAVAENTMRVYRKALTERSV